MRWKYFLAALVSASSSSPTMVRSLLVCGSAVRSKPTAPLNRSNFSSLASCVAAATSAGVLRAAMAFSSANSALLSAEPSTGGGGRKRLASTAAGSSNPAWAVAEMPRSRPHARTICFIGIPFLEAGRDRELHAGRRRIVILIQAVGAIIDIIDIGAAKGAGVIDLDLQQVALVQHVVDAEGEVVIIQ